MLKNYLQIMLRNALTHKLYAGINILGLSCGIAFALLIGIFTWTELSVNKELKDVKHIFMLEASFPKSGGFSWFTHTPLVPSMMEKYPGVVTDYYRFFDRNVSVSKGDQHLRIQSMVGDSTLIEFFGFRVLSGSSKKSLSEPNSIVLTEAIAKSFFGRTDVAGEQLTITSEGKGLNTYQITAVIAEPVRKNTATDFMNMNAQVFLPFANAAEFSNPDLRLDEWATSMITFVRTATMLDHQEIAAKLNGLQRAEATNVIAENELIEVRPLTTYYLNANNGSVRNLLNTLAVVVIFILLIALANFVNMTVSGSFSRLKEIGVRKAIGGIRTQIVSQFISESVMYALVSGIVGLIVYESFRSWFGVVLDTSLPSVINFPPTIWLALLGFIALIGLCAGAYPAYYLAKIRTIESLKGKPGKSSGRIVLSRVLIGVQFSIAAFILISAVIMTEQISFFLGKDLGYSKESIIIISSAPRRWTPEGYTQMQSYKREFLKDPNIASLSLSTGSPAGNFAMDGDNILPVGRPATDTVAATITGSDDDFANVYQMKMADGQYFSDDRARQDEVVINQSAANRMKVHVSDLIRLQNFGERDFRIVGIVNDFNSESLHSLIGPVVILPNDVYLRFRAYSVKLRPGNLVEAIRSIESTWKKIYPDEAFTFTFAEERVRQQYKTDLQLKRASTLASILMLVMVMTGVVGLVSLSVARRTKEMGIRKVLGASVSTVLMLLSREYLVILGLSFLIAIPGSYLFSTGWLSTFVEHVDLSIWMFALPAASILAITIVIISLRGLKTATSNPVKALRYE